MRFRRLRRRRDLLKGAVAGVAGGLIGAWTMNQFQAALGRAQENCSGASGLQQREGEDATTKTAEWLLDSLGMHLTKDQKTTAGRVVHYSFGAAMGGLYGVLEEYGGGRPGPAHGAMLGAALFIGADEVAVPVLGLSEPSAKYPLSVHASSLAAHLVYGLTAEVVRRKVRRALLLVRV